MRTILIALAAGLLCFGCRTSSARRDFSGAPPRQIVATIKCSDPAMKFTGEIVSDGHVQKYSGVGSGTYQASGHEIICSFKKLEADGRLSLAAGELGREPGSSSTVEPFGGVRARFLYGPEMEHTVFTTFQ